MRLLILHKLIGKIENIKHIMIFERFSESVKDNHALHFSEH